MVKEEEVDNTFVESPKKLLAKTATPTQAQVFVPADKPEESSEEEHDKDSESELNSLSPKLGYVVTKSSTMPVRTSTAKNFLQTESILVTSEKAKVDVATKGEKPIVAIELDDTN